MENKQLLGAWGEMQAVDHLRKKGYAILACNYRCRLGEIDIIAKNREYRAIVEARSGGSAERGLCELESALQRRFDVREVYAPEGEKTARPVIRHWENAFA